jgi:predicted nuclease of predicted toxin-antitoxin system
VKLKLDENLPASAAHRLRALGFDAHTVVAEGLGGRSDADVWTAGGDQRRALGDVHAR